MTRDLILETKRLVLRRWRPDDLEPFATLNADPRVMEFFPAVMSKDETAAMMKTIQGKIEEHGFGLWAVELKETRELIGFVGLNVPGYPLPFSPCVEIGWRLAFPFWGRGLAQEGARAALEFGFQKLVLKQIVSFTTENNIRSRKVMDANGMQYDSSADFDHPKLEEGHLLRRHVLYRIKSAKKGKAQ